MFVSHLGSALYVPLLALYFAVHLRLPPLLVGLLLALSPLTGMVGQVAGGWAADRLARLPVLLAGFALEILGVVVLAVMPDPLAEPAAGLGLAAAGVALIGLADAGRPALMAMVADLTPSDRRQEAYGLQATALALAVAIGPAIGGLAISVAAFRPVLLADDVLTAAAGLAISLLVGESRGADTREGEGVRGTRGYGVALHDRALVALMGLFFISSFAFAQLYSGLPVYWTHVQHFNAAQLGLLWGWTGVLVLILQTPLARAMSRRPVAAMGLAMLLLGLTYPWLVLVRPYLGLMALALPLMVGQMLFQPAASATVAALAAPSQRGRYSAAMGTMGGLTFAVAPVASGVALQGTHYGPQFFLATALLVCLSALLYPAFGRWVAPRLARAAPAAEFAPSGGRQPVSV
jgi:MFS family permease